MARGTTVRKIIEVQASEELKIPSLGGGGPPASPVISREPIVSNARLALIMLLASEAMLFAGLIGAFLVFRLSGAPWPPPFQPRLPVVATGINTVFLLLSGFAMQMALRAVRLGALRGLVKYLWTTVLLGALFLSIQGYEWVRLIKFGLKVSSGIYGAMFYMLIGCHGLHVLGAVLWLIVVSIRARHGGFTASRRTEVEICGMYWTFVVALWPILYGLVYLY